MNIRPKNRVIGANIDYKKAPFAFVENVYKHTVNNYGREIEVVSATTTCCGADVEKSQYGFDEECPNCEKMINWDETERDKYIATEKEKAVTLLNEERKEIQENLKNLLEQLSSESENLEEFAKALLENIDEYSSDGLVLSNTHISYSDDDLKTDSVNFCFKNKYIIANVLLTDNKIVLEQRRTGYNTPFDNDRDYDDISVRKDVVSTVDCKDFIQSCFDIIDKKEYEKRFKNSKIKEMNQELNDCYSLKDYKSIFEIYKKYESYLNSVPMPLDVLKKIAQETGNNFNTNYCIFEQTDEGWTLKISDASKIRLEDGTIGTKYGMKTIASGEGILHEDLDNSITFEPKYFPHKNENKKEYEYFENCLAGTFIPDITEWIHIGKETSKYISEDKEEVYIPIESEILLFRGISVDEDDCELAEELARNDVFFDENGRCNNESLKDKTIRNLVRDCVKDGLIQLKAVKDGDSFELVVDILDGTPDYIDYDDYPLGRVWLTETERKSLGKFIEFSKEKEIVEDMERF